MSKITITIHTDNDAFQDDPYSQIADILESIAHNARGGADFEDYAYDVNGNKCGTIKVSE
jgi:hypothetical protein